MKIKLFLLVFAIVFSNANLCAADFTVDSIAYTITSATAPYTVAVAQKSSGYSGAVIIPAAASYNSINYSVTSIGSYAFYKCTGLSSITFPSSITSIGDQAFNFCTGLTSVTIPNSVTSIGASAFFQCPYLTSVAIGNSVISIGTSAFQACNHLTAVTIPNSVTSIGDYAFQGCGSFTSVTIGNSVTSIGTSAFQACSGLFYVDANNPNYSSVNEVLYNKDQTTLVQCPTSKTGSFVILLTVTSIGEYSFYGCTGLTSITIPNSVTSIGDMAFGLCSGLTSVTIPNSVTSIGFGAFYNTGLTSVYADSPTPIVLSSSDIFYNEHITTRTLYVPTGSKSLYAAAAVWKNFTNIVEHIVTGISTVPASKLNIRVIGHKVEIGLPEASAPVQVVDISGRQLYNGKPTGSILSVTLPQAGVYLVRVGNITATLVVK